MSLNDCDIIKDYKKLARRRQVNLSCDFLAILITVNLLTLAKLNSKPIQIFNCLVNPCIPGLLLTLNSLEYLVNLLDTDFVILIL